MKIFAISDLHLSLSVEKPMDIFGDGWQNHFEKISTDWQNKVTDDDLILLGGDMSWGLTLDEAEADYNAVSSLPGKKIVLRGNHDFYWNSLSKIEKKFPNFEFLQNNCIRVGDTLIAGTRGWTIPTENSTDDDKKIYTRELLRLELSLKAMQQKRKDGDLVIAMLHFPPFEANYADTEVTNMLEKFKVDKVLYGHLHGKNARIKRSLEKNGITYYLTSCDLIDFKLVEIAEVLQ
ncbi:MAG: metallophosphoesterase [Clostridia bacterium]